MAIEHWVTLVPDTNALEKGIEAAFDAAKKAATVEVKTDPNQARKAGEDAGKAINKGAKDAVEPINPKVDKTAAEKAGKQTGEDVSKGTKEATQGIGAAIGEALKGAAIKVGTDVGTKIGHHIGEGIITGDLKGAVGRIGATLADTVRGGVEVAKRTVGNVVGGILSGNQAQLAAALKADFGGAVAEAVPDFVNQLNTKIRSGIVRLGASKTGQGIMALSGKTASGAELVSGALATGKSTLEGFSAGLTGAVSNAGDSLAGIQQLVGSDSWAAPGLDELQSKLTTITPLIGGIASAAGLAQTGIDLMSGASKVATGIQWAFNAAMSANPLGLIVTAIGAVVAGLVLFFTKTEIGRKIWETCWNAIKAAVSGAWNFIKGAFDKITAAIGGVVDWLKEHWKLLPILAGPVGAAVSLVLTHWDKIKGGATAVWTWVSEKFTAMVNFVKGLPGKITTAAKGLWDGLKNGLKEAVNWIIDKLNGLGGGISGFINKIPGVNISIPQIPRLAGGGTVTGPGSGTSDSILGYPAMVRVSNGEFVVNALAARKNLPLLEAINSGALQRFDQGGLVGAGPSPLNQYAQGMVGRKYSMATRDDCSGTMSELANVATGRPPRSSLMTTVNEGSWLQQRGFILGRGGPGTFRIGWFDHGGGANGHTAGTLPDGTNVESSGSTGMFTMGAAARGADDPMFDKHAYLPMSPQGQTIGGGGGAAVGGSGSGGSSGGGFGGFGGSGGGSSISSGGGGGGSTGMGNAGGASDQTNSILDQLKSIGEGGLKETFLPEGFSDPMSWPNVQSGMALLKFFGGLLSGQGSQGQGLVGDTRGLAPGELNPAITAGGSASLVGGAEGMMTQLTQGGLGPQRQGGANGGGGGIDNSTNFYGNVDGDVSKAMQKAKTERVANTRVTTGPLQLQ